ncbi:MAG: serine hydrolase [Proteobacteria bacterium]|nr:serine hydrolase [Pseudomonadota bacterium]MDA0975830.1 serine hydrolase [Pseudomonadota bacterium]MDA1037006.1 serine hydrolase [Pseudomonadota bacterium]
MKQQTLSIYLLSLFIFFSFSLNSAEIYFPGSTWDSVSPESQNIESKNVQTLIDLAFTDNATLGVVVIKNGRIIGEKYAAGYNMNSHGTSWSMAKSYYAALVGISIDKGEINSLDDKVENYLEYFGDERSEITIRDLLNMSSGLDFPSHEHEKMFFQDDHLGYAKSIGVEKKAGLKFEYNNVNSMLIGDILYQATGKKADVLFKERILDTLEINDYKLWKDEKGNVMTYCCVDMSARDYSKFGLLFARNGMWNSQQIISKEFVDETFQLVWDITPERFTRLKRGYSLHWWVSAYEDNFKIFNTSGKFGQYTFVDRENDIIVTRITKYNQQDSGDIQKWGIMKYLKWAGVENAINLGRILIENGAIESGSDVITPFTDEEGESKEFYTIYGDFIGAIENLSCNCYPVEASN